MLDTDMENRILKEKLAQHVSSFIDMEQCHQAAVCIPLVKKADGTYDILFEVRSSAIAHQPGDICLPGGMLEEDEGPRDAALRELQEELLLEDRQICYIGEMDKLYTTSNMIVYSYVAEVKNYREPFNTAEVEEIFAVPLEYFLNTEPKCYTIRAKVDPGEDFPYELICGGRDYKWSTRKEKIYFYQYNGRVIWGLTAKIMRAFIKVVKEECKM